MSPAFSCTSDLLYISTAFHSNIFHLPSLDLSLWSLPPVLLLLLDTQVVATFTSVNRVQGPESAFQSRLNSLLFLSQESPTSWLLSGCAWVSGRLGDLIMDGHSTSMY